jgi:hypothetical protein
VRNHGDPTVASAWQDVAGIPIAPQLLGWPPDVFALTDVILERSQAYRFAVAAVGNAAWPPAPSAGWAASVEAAGRRWSACVGRDEAPLPELVTREWGVLLERAGSPLEDLADGRDWRLCEAVLTLHAIADEACAGLGGALDSSDAHSAGYRGRGRELLTRTGSLARLPTHRLCVLPKARTPPSGTSLGALARYACVQRSGVDVRWHKLPSRRRGISPRAEHANLLLLPWPLRVRESDFRPVEGSVQRVPGEPFGLFEFDPSERLDLDLVDRMLVAARDEVDNVDGVVLPESALDEDEVAALEALLDHHGVSLLHTGVRQRHDHPRRLSGNWVHTGASPRLERGGSPPGATCERWFHIRQNKHNRWLLDERQIYQYHLGGALHPNVRWWEAMEVPRRSVQFIQIGEVTVCILVCEDLSQNDHVAGVLRSVGPTVVLAPLLDGPQLPSRWAARYASVLADDPGSGVLTLTSYGMAQRSRPNGLTGSPVIALWRDPVRGTRQIALEAGALGVLLTCCVDRTIRRTRDGRTPVENGTDFFDVGVQQIRPAGAGSGPPAPSLPTRVPPVLDVEELTILTSWAEAAAEALASAPEHLEATLADARAGAPWRAALAIAEPSPQLGAALEYLSTIVRATPSVGALRVAMEGPATGGHGPDALACRVLRSTLESRVARQTVTGARQR